MAIKDWFQFASPRECFVKTTFWDLTYFLFICSGGSSSTGIGHGSLPRPGSPSRRGMPGHNSGAPLGSRHQQTGRGTSFNRNAENSDWRFNREGSHEEYASSSYQHQQQQTSQSYDRWGNDFRTGNTNAQIVFVARTKLRVTVKLRRITWPGLAIWKIFNIQPLIGVK